MGDLTEKFLWVIDHFGLFCKPNRKLVPFVKKIGKINWKYKFQPNVFYSRWKLSATITWNVIQSIFMQILPHNIGQFSNYIYILSISYSRAIKNNLRVKCYFFFQKSLSGVKNLKIETSKFGPKLAYYKYFKNSCIILRKVRRQNRALGVNSRISKLNVSMILTTQSKSVYNCMIDKS